MRAFGSVAAFIAEWAAGDRDAAAVVDGLDEEARLVIAAQVQLPAARRAWLHERSGREWSAAWLSHVEQRAFVQIRRELQRRGLWRA